MQSPGQAAGRDPNSIVTHVNRHTNDIAGNKGGKKKKKRNFLFMNAKLAVAWHRSKGDRNKNQKKRKEEREEKKTEIFPRRI